MGADTGTGAVREIGMVVVLAASGLLLALLAAFAPWYGPPVQSRGNVVVEMHAPTLPAAAPRLSVTEVD